MDTAQQKLNKRVWKEFAYLVQLPDKIVILDSVHSVRDFLCSLDDGEFYSLQKRFMTKVKKLVQGEIVREQIFKSDKRRWVCAKQHGRNIPAFFCNPDNNILECLECEYNPSVLRY